MHFSVRFIANTTNCPKQLLKLFDILLGFVFPLGVGVSRRVGGTQPDRSLQQASRQATVACHPHIASHSHSRSPLFLEFQQHSKGIQPSFFLFLGRSLPISSFIQRPCFNNVYCTLSTSFITFICFSQLTIKIC